MKFMNKLERKFGRYAVPNLMLYIIILNAAGLLITIMYPQAQYYLCWSTSAILHGQIWRIVSFILVPYTTSPVNFLIFAFLYYSISQTLERVWGSFRMDMYIITGLLGTIVAAFLVYFVFGVEMGMQVSISYLSNSLFLALAATFPDVQFLLFFIIPIKAKWMALLSAVMYLYDLMQVVNGLGWMPYGFAMLIMIVFSLINFISKPDFFRFLAIEIDLFFSPSSLPFFIPSLIPSSLSSDSIIFCPSKNASRAA